MLIFSIYVFLLTCFLGFLVYGIYVFLIKRFGVRAKRLDSRLKILLERNFIQENATSIFKQRAFSKNEEINSFFKKYPFFYSLDVLILRAGLHISLHQFINFLALIFLIVFILTLSVTGSFFKAIICGLLFAFTPIIILRIQDSKRQAIIQNQLPDILEYIARSLNAGHSFNSAIQSAAMESPDPIASEFKMTFEQLNLGVSVRDAMGSLIKRIDTEDIRFFAIAVSINREVGGNLSELLGEVSGMMRARLSSKLSVKALAAEGKASAAVLGALPILALAAILIFMPNYYDELLKSPSGNIVISSTIVLFLFGFLWMRSMTNIRI